MKFLFYLLMFCCSYPLLAQQHLWKRFGVAEGVEGTITVIAQSHEGMMWFGSQSGLICFNGTSFTKIPVALHEVQPYIQSVLIDKKGNVWAGTRKGLWKYDAGKHTFSQLPLPVDPLYISDMVWNADSTVIYAATYDGLKRITASDLPVMTKHAGKEAYFRIFRNGQDIYALLGSSVLRIRGGRTDTLYTGKSALGLSWHEQQQRIIFCSAEAIVLIDTSGRIQTWHPPFDPGILGMEQPVYIDKKNRLWFNTIDTLYCFSSLGDKKPFRHCRQNNNAHAPLVFLNRMLLDKDDNMWVAGSGTGLAMLDSRVGKIKFFPSSQASSSHIWNIYHDKKEGKLLLGTNHHIAVYDLQHQAMKIVPNPPGMKRFIVTKVFSKDDRYWYVSTYGAGAFLLDKKNYSYARLDNNFYLYGMLREESEGLLMYGESGVYRLKERNRQMQRLPTRNPEMLNVFDVIKLGSGNYCYGSNNGVVIATETDRLASYSNTTTGGKLGVVFSVFETKDRKLFAANMDGGLYRLNFSLSKFARVELAGNPSIVYCIGAVSDSCIIVTTNNGLVLYNHYSGQSQSLNRNNGLPFNDFDQFGYFADDEYFSASGPEGAILVNRKDLLSLFEDKVPLRLRWNGSIVQNITIPAGEQSVSAQIDIGNKQASHTLEYRYILYGLENSWHESGRGNEVSYNYLPPGEYTLLVKAIDRNRLVHAAFISIPISVIPLWYQTIWFKAVLIAGCAALLAGIVRYISRVKLRWKLRKLEGEQKVASERIRISRELHDNVGSQLTYLITGLEASELMLKQQQTERLNANLDQLQQSARDSMQQLRDAIWALNKEDMSMEVLASRFREWVQKMLEMQGPLLHFETEITQNVTLDAIKALNLFRLLQEAIHNVIKHAHATELFVKIRSENDNIICSIEDNGRGFHVGNARGNGLTNMKARASEISASLHVESTENKGTTVTLVIPANTLNG